jgi:transcription antitermination factor NusG
MSPTKSPSFVLADLSTEELLKLNSVFVAEIKFRQATAARVAKQTFKDGDSVKFMSSKYKRFLTGTVTKVAPKFITVDCGMLGSWRVPGGKIQFV